MPSQKNVRHIALLLLLRPGKRHPRNLAASVSQRQGRHILWNSRTSGCAVGLGKYKVFGRLRMPLRSRAPLGLERLRGLWTPMRPFHSRSWTKERPEELDEVTERCCAAGRDGCTRIPPHSKYFQGYTLAIFRQNSLSYIMYIVCTCKFSSLSLMNCCRNLHKALYIMLSRDMIMMM